MKTFRFQFRGVAAYLFGPAAVRDLSLVKMATSLPEHTINPSSFGIRWLEFFFLVFSGSTVVVFLGVLFVLWVWPMTIRQHRKVLVVAQVLNSVAGLDVFVVTVLVSVLQLQGYAAFILEELHLDKINDSLNGIVPNFPFIADKIDDDDYSIRVTSSLLPGFIMLASACVVSTVLGLAVLGKCSKALFDVEHRPIQASFADAGSVIFNSQARSSDV